MTNSDPRNVPLETGVFYHIYNRGNGGENVFRETRNYEYFMRLYGQHLGPFVETFAYCLLKNHFHLLVQITVPPPGAKIDATQAFANWFNAYAKGYNKTYARNGSLFQRPFRRVAVKSEPYLFNLVRYIHRNPQKHGFVPDFREWEYSSYADVTGWKRDGFSNVTGFWKPVTFETIEKLLDWFGGLQQFRDFHVTDSDVTGFGNLSRLNLSRREFDGIIGEDPD